MATITIPKNLIKDDLVIIPRRRFQEFVSLEKKFKNILKEYADTDLAIAVYKKEKQQRKLKTIMSLAELS